MLQSITCNQNLEMENGKGTKMLPSPKAWSNVVGDKWTLQEMGILPMHKPTLGKTTSRDRCSPNALFSTSVKFIYPNVVDSKTYCWRIDVTLGIMFFRRCIIVGHSDVGRSVFSMPCWLHVENSSSDTFLWHSSWRHFVRRRSLPWHCFQYCQGTTTSGVPWLFCSGMSLTTRLVDGIKRWRMEVVDNLVWGENLRGSNKRDKKKFVGFGRNKRTNEDRRERIGRLL